MKSNLGIGITGMAEDSKESLKDAGLVYISICSAAGVSTQKFNFLGNRQYIRLTTLEKSLEMLASVLDG